MTDLIPIEYQGERILTTEQLAQIYECESTHLKQNFNNNLNKFIEGKHYFKLEGADLKTFKNSVENFDLVDKRAPSLMLWTKRGASRHCKMLGTDKAWEQFDVLEESYFEPKPDLLTKPMTQLEIIAANAAALVEQERRMNEIAVRQDAQDKALQGIREVVALNPNDWRKDTSAMLNKMAHSMGGYEHLKPLRSESYKLLDDRFGVDLNCRLTNKRRRMADEGVCKSKRDKLNQLDVIGDDKKLIEGYIAIIKEMAIKYGVAA